MAMKKCELCNTEYDDEIYDNCPGCMQSEFSEDIIPQDEPAERAEMAEYFEQDNAPVEGAVPDKDKTKLILTIVAAVLAVLVVLCATWLTYRGVAGVAPDTIDVGDFGLSDIEGTYTDDINGIYYTFAIEECEIEVPAQTGDSEADSSASKAVGKTMKFDGTFVSGISESFVPTIVAEYYISYNDKTEDYEDYKKKHNISGDDFEGYINFRKLGSELDDFDAQQGISAYYDSLEIKGYWSFSDGELSLYSDSGEEDGTLTVTKNGLVNAAALFIGKTPRKGYNNAQYVLEDTKNGYTQVIRTYKDGYCILEIIGEDDQPQISAGTYEATGEEIIIDIGGGKNRFRFVDFGITGYLLNK